MIALLKKSGHSTTRDRSLERLPGNLRRLRKQQRHTLDELSLRSGVSRAMISKIERGTAIPTATVLGKLARGLEVGLSRLLGGQLPRRSRLTTAAEQPVFRDPESGLARRSLSPLFPDRSGDFALNVLPPGREVSFPAHHDGVEEYLYVSKGELRVTVADESFVVKRGSTLFYQANAVHVFKNATRSAVEFFIVIDDTSA